MSYDQQICIERMGNGFKVCVTDPEIVKQNEKSKGGYKSPRRDYAFESKEKVFAFLEKNFDAALPPDADDAFATAFDKAAKAVDKET